MRELTEMQHHQFVWCA